MKRSKSATIKLCAAIAVLTSLAVYGLTSHYRSHRETVGRDAAGGVATNDTDDSTRDVIQFDLVCRDRPGQLLYEILIWDSIAVIDTAACREDGTIRVAAGRERLVWIFQAEISTRKVARSSGDGFYEQQYLDRYEIPEKYLRFIREIRLPDPQVE